MYEMPMLLIRTQDPLLKYHSVPTHTPRLYFRFSYPTVPKKHLQISGIDRRFLSILWRSNPMELYGLQSSQQPAEWSHDIALKNTMRRFDLWRTEVYPDRPGQPDCTYYMRTGSCGYGAKCRFNHPRDRGIEFGEQEYPERVGEPACQYYLRTGTCKFGASCRFNHPKNVGESFTSIHLNIYGYPLRSGEKECSYYLKTGQCKFGITCKFDHPQPAGSSIPASARPFYPTGQPLSSLSAEQSSSSSTSYRVARPPLLSGSYVSGTYGHMLLHPGVVSISNWNPYSGTVNPAPSSCAQPSVIATSVYGMSQLVSSTPPFSGAYPQVHSSSSGVNKGHPFPERPGHTDCEYYMRTGDCKYGLSCRYNHPPDWVVSKTSCALNSLGLPLRPGMQACTFYLQRGQCKFGQMCKFDHPMANAKYSPSSSYSEMPGTPYAAGFNTAFSHS